MQKVVKQIRDAAEKMRARILRNRKPSMSVPVRSLSNVSYQPRRGYFKLNGARVERTLTPEDTIDCENGAFPLPGKTIRDHKPYGALRSAESHRTDREPPTVEC